MYYHSSRFLGGGREVSAQELSAEMIEPATSINGWILQNPNNLESTVEERDISGLGTSYQVVLGDVENILSDLARQIHYRVKSIRPGEVRGWIDFTDDLFSPYSNLSSGTALQINPHTPVDAYFSYQIEIVRQILTDYSHVVAWGADDSTHDESLFYISASPNSPEFLAVADRVRQQRPADISSL